MEIPKNLLKILPYLASFLAGCLFYYLGISNEVVYDLFINISAAFFAIPLIYLFYQLTYKRIHKTLIKEINDYLKMQIDKEILSIINQLQKIVCPLEKKDFSEGGISNFLHLKANEIEKTIRETRYLGFQLYKNWNIFQDNLNKILMNPLIVGKIDDEKITSIISIIKSTRHLEEVQKMKDVYVNTGKETKSYKIVSGKELNKDNIKFPDRYLLLKKLGDNKFIVDDFGDIAVYNLDKVLNIFKVNDKYLEIYSECIIDLINDIKNWLSLTGEEFVIDTKEFRMAQKYSV